MLLTGAAYALVGAAPAHAHTELDYSIPADGASLGTTPGAIQLIFTEPVEAELSAVVVEGPGGSTLADGPVRQAATGLIQPLVEPPNGGTVTVTYRTVSLDGHPVTGSFSFDVARGNPDAAPPQPQNTGTEDTQAASAPAGDDDAGAAAVWLLVGAAAVLLLVAVGAILARRRRAPATPASAPAAHSR